MRALMRMACRSGTINKRSINLVTRGAHTDLAIRSHGLKPERLVAEDGVRGLPLSTSGCRAHENERSDKSTAHEKKLTEPWIHLRHLSENNKRVIQGDRRSARDAFAMEEDIIVLGENAINYSEAVMHYDLTQGKSFNGTVPANKWEDKVDGIATALRAHDLVVTIDDRFSRLSFYQFSTGKPHPLAGRPQIDLPEMTIPSHKNNRRYNRAQIEVCGPRLLVRLCTFDYPGPCKLIVVDWWRGEIATTIDLGQNQGGSLCFLTEDLVLDTCSTGGVLRVYQLPELNAPKSVNSRAVMLSLGLPRLNPEYEYNQDVLCRMRPAPIGALHPLARAGELKAWASEPGGENTSDSDALVKVVLAISSRSKAGRYLFGWQSLSEYYSYSLVVRRSTIWELMNQYRHHLSSSTQTRIIPWEEWGPASTHIYDDIEPEVRRNTQNVSLHHDLYALRVVISEPERTILRDFDPQSIKWLRETSVLHPAVDPDGDDQQRLVVDSDMSVAVVDRTSAIKNKVFAQPVTFSLPYVETAKKFDNSRYQDLLLGKDFIVGVHGGLTTAIPSIDVFRI